MKISKTILILGSSIISLCSCSLFAKFYEHEKNENVYSFTFKLEGKEYEPIYDHTIYNSDIEYFSSIMDGRLQRYGVKKYTLSIKDENTIVASISATSKSFASSVAYYISSNGRLRFMNNCDDFIDYKDLKSDDAYLTSTSSYPTLVIPIKSYLPQFTNLVQHAKENPISNEPEDEEFIDSAALFLTTNILSTDTYSSLLETNQLEPKLLITFTFNPDNEEELYYDSEMNSLFVMFGFQDLNGDGVANPQEVAGANEHAHIIYSMLNLEQIPFSVSYYSNDL